MGMRLIDKKPNKILEEMLKKNKINKAFGSECL